MKRFLKIILLLGVLGLSILVFMEYMKEKNMLALSLIGLVGLLTIINIFRYTEDFRGTTILILGVLCYLGVGDINTILFFMIFLQFLGICFCCSDFSDLKFAIIDIISFIIYNAALVVCIFRIANNEIFDFFHIGILVISCMPLFVNLLYQIARFMGTYISIGIKRTLFCISNCILLIFSIILKVKHIDDSALFFGLMAIISIVGVVINFWNDGDWWDHILPWED